MTQSRSGTRVATLSASIGSRLTSWPLSSQALTVSKERVLCNVMVDELGDEAGTYQLDKEEHEKVLSVLGLDA